MNTVALPEAARPAEAIDLVARARARGGFLTNDEIDEFLATHDLTPDQVEAIQTALT
ncbi:MAG: RNA polymerase sigma factor region1.1 domain-containing protein, partial [Actinomycetota bacterium]